MSNSSRVIVASYNANWAEYFIQEANRINALLQQSIQEIHHIGSTAIPNMVAKPVIDILLECKNLDTINTIDHELSKLGYARVRRHIVPHRSFFTRKIENTITFHVHIREIGDSQIKRHINFRDYLIIHNADAKVYAELKTHLAKLYENDINNYIIGKDKFIQQIDNKAKIWDKRRQDFMSTNTGVPYQYWNHEKLVKAMDANFNVHMTYFAQYLNNVELIRVPGYTIVNSRLMDDMFNYVLDTDLTLNNVDIKVSEIIQYFTSTNTPFSWWVNPYDQPPNLPTYLEQHGLYNTDNKIGMYLDLDNWDNTYTKTTNLEIVRVITPSQLQDFTYVPTNNEYTFKTYHSWLNNVMTPDDPIEFYVAYVNGKALSRAKIVFSAQVAALYHTATSEELRHDCALAIEIFLLEYAKKLGYHILVLQASLADVPLYKKIGFKECCIFRQFKHTKLS